MTPMTFDDSWISEAFAEWISGSRFFDVSQLFSRPYTMFCHFTRNVRMNIPSFNFEWFLIDQCDKGVFENFSLTYLHSSFAMRNFWPIIPKGHFVVHTYTWHAFHMWFALTNTVASGRPWIFFDSRIAGPQRTTICGVHFINDSSFWSENFLHESLLPSFYVF